MEDDYQQFQSTPPCGGDSIPDILHAFSGNFNPRPLAGATNPHDMQVPFIQDFNPRPLAGATATRMICRFRSFRISIHAPLRGRLASMRYRVGVYVFQSTPPCGGDLDTGYTSRFFWEFQSTPPCGGDTRFPAQLVTVTHFNPRPLAGATLRAARRLP